MKKNYAFTLIELSVVVVVIAVLIAGVIKGSSLINAARLSTARSLTARAVVPQISGLVAWYETSLRSSFKASEVVIGSEITEWRDANPPSIAEQKNTLSRSVDNSVTFQPRGINDLPSLYFKNTGQLYLDNFDQGSFGRSTVFIVFHPINSFAGTLFNSSGNTSISINNDAIGINAGNPFEVEGNSFSAKDYIVTAYFNGDSSKIFLNDNSINGSGDAGNNAISGLLIGSDDFEGMISEVIIYNRPLKAFEFNDVMSYLSKKYKISVAVRL